MVKRRLLWDGWSTYLYPINRTYIEYKYYTYEFFFIFTIPINARWGIGNTAQNHII